ncbi:HEPN domain-containing protein [Peribacillus sp. SI8-4]|uniref:HEPN domain-containing protein n=1 Tax=Peribacillus sp. SI8-4 TaxID=3048009 RepID=UPI00255440A4|nr:HEPN domain-containing protein [Peribacillus sp. SI8-4]
MTELFTAAAKHIPINLPFEPFKNSVVCYEIIMYQDEEMIKAFLLKSKKSEVPAYLLIGVSTITGDLFGINKYTAIQVLNQILNRLTTYKNQNEKISVDDINVAIKLLEQISDEILENGDNLIKLGNHFYGLIDINEDEKTSLKMQIQVSEEDFITPLRFNFVGYSGSDDYGEIVLKDVFEMNLKTFHLINEIPIYVDYGEGMQKYYLALIISVRKENNSTVTLNFNTNVYNLKKSTLGLLISENTDPRYLIDFMVRSNGWKADIEGIEEHIQPYIVLIPVHNILVETESIGIGNVELLASDSDNYDIALMKEKLKDKFGHYTLAKVNVDSQSPYAAYSQAKKQIEDALNAINHIVKQDSLFELYSTQDYITEWKRDVFVPKPKVGSLVYVRNLVTNGLVVSDMEKIVEPNILTLDESFNEKIENLDWYEDLIAANMDNDVSEEMKNLLNALKWLKRSWDSTNLEDQIIFSNISIEFLLSDEKVSPLVNKGIRKKVVAAALNEFNSVFDGSKEEKDKLSEDIKGKFSSSLTNAPLFAKLRNLIATLEIPITKTDENSLNLIRKKRNDLVHGRATENIEMMDVWKSNTIIGMIIAYKMKHKGGK